MESPTNKIGETFPLWPTCDGVMHENQTGSSVLQVVQNLYVFGGWCRKINWGIAAGELQSGHVIENDNVISSRWRIGSCPCDVVDRIKDSKECIGDKRVSARDNLNRDAGFSHGRRMPIRP